MVEEYVFILKVHVLQETFGSARKEDVKFIKLASLKKKLPNIYEWCI